MCPTSVSRLLVSGSLLILMAPAALAQAGEGAHPEPPPEATAARASAALTLDGALDEAVWEAATPVTGFRQSEPREGEPATQRTEVRFLFDDDALYVGARMFDDQGARGVRTQLVRRDVQPESDFLVLRFDTYHDHIGSAFFAVNPSGVKGDQLNGDPSWDPVWDAAMRVDSLGWTAEIRIPFSQLRFPVAREQTWGLQVDRRVARLNEFSRWAFWRQNEGGGPSRYGHLTGLVIERRHARAEVLPYAVAQASRLAPGRAGDPFYRTTDGTLRAGLDLSYRLTSNLTLSATVNPDFGQVEVDPAVVNLSAFETFFPERRPFFVEGSGYFGFGGLWCFFCSDASSLGMFYSRRIGRAPQGAALAHAAGEFADVPQNTTILGAAKVTGKTASGWSVAVLDALTAEEQARVATPEGERLRVAVEPLSNYFVARVKRDLRDGNLVVGGIATSTYRDLPTSEFADRLSGHAEGVGVDAELWWARRTYHWMGQLGVSNVSGEPAAIDRLQRSSARYFQRPDREHGSNDLFSDAYDPLLESLRGYGLYSRLSRESGDWLWEAAVNLRSPGFENNDIAFLTRSDYLWHNANLLRQFTQPTRWFRRLTLIAGGQQQFNYDGDLTDRQLNAFLGTQLPNYWELSTFHIHRPGSYDDRLTRGGPVVRRVGSWFQALNLSTDSRRRVVLSTNPNFSRNELGNESYSVNLGVLLRPASNVSVSLSPSYSRSASSYQYVTAQPDPTATAFHGARYVFADLDQKTLSMNTRLSMTFTPTVSLELFAQPFVSSAAYSGFKEFVAPRSSSLRVYGVDGGTIESSGDPGDRIYQVDPDGAGPATPFSFRDPDFNFRSLRGNAVMRWEYRPGSTLFLVWTQDRSDRAAIGDLDFGRDREALFSAPPNNIFLIKVNYWLGM
jgi:hypothetical protein